jgi:hypothetical protein
LKLVLKSITCAFTDRPSNTSAVAHHLQIKQHHDGSQVFHCLLVVRSCFILMLVIRSILSRGEPLLYSTLSDYNEWNVSSCGADVVSDVLLEMGAVSAEVVLLGVDEPVMAAGEDFDRANRIPSRHLFFSFHRHYCGKVGRRSLLCSRPGM